MNEEPTRCANCQKTIPAYAYEMHLALCKRINSPQPEVVRSQTGSGNAYIVEKRHDRICQFPHCNKKCWPNWIYCPGHHKAMTKAFGYAE